jgi:hypothetical protein
MRNDEIVLPSDCMTMPGYSNSLPIHSPTSPKAPIRDASESSASNRASLHHSPKSQSHSPKLPAINSPKSLAFGGLNALTHTSKCPVYGSDVLVLEHSPNSSRYSPMSHNTATHLRRTILCQHRNTGPLPQVQKCRDRPHSLATKLP